MSLQRAAQLLELVERQEDELDRIRREEPDRHLMFAASGDLGRLSRDRQWSVELAIAHALVAIGAALEAEPEKASEWLERMKADLPDGE
jgi:hypothetical protein